MTTDATMRRPAVITLAVYGALMAVIAFFPTPVDRAVYPWITRALARLHDRGLPGWLSYQLLESGANVALFVPFGILAAFVFGPCRTWLARFAIPDAARESPESAQAPTGVSVVASGIVNVAMLGLTATIAIELAQWMLLPQRVPSGIDVVANTTGAAVGAAIGYVVLLLRAPGRNPLRSEPSSI